jgi:hypothetical protein
MGRRSHRARPVAVRSPAQRRPATGGLCCTGAWTTPATVGGGGRDAPSARAASLASSAALPRTPGGGPHRSGSGAVTLQQPLRQALRHSLRQRWRTPPISTNAHRSSSVPLRGNGASARQGALRAIDSFRPSRSWRTCGPRRLRRQSAPSLVATHGERCLDEGRAPASQRPRGWLNRRGPLPAAAPAPALATRPSAAPGGSRTRR